MAIRRSRSVLSKKRKNRQELLSSMHRKPRRDMHIERLEDRQLLAGAQLIGIQPNDGALLQTGDIRNVAPADLTFRFDQNQIIDPASLGSSTEPAASRSLAVTWMACLRRRPSPATLALGPTGC